MNKRDRKRLQGLLAELTDGERRQLYVRATKLLGAAGKANRAQGPRLRFGPDSTEEAPPPARRRSPAGSLDDYVLRLLLERRDSPEAPADTATAAGASATGLVMRTGPGRCIVRVAGEDRDCTLGAELAGRQASELAVGDDVVVSRHGDDYHVDAVLPRRSLLSRPDPHVPTRRLAIVANVDVVVIVAAAASPPFRPGLVDRYLVATHAAGTQAMLCLNKIDLDGPDSAALAALPIYERLGLQVLRCSAATGAGLAELRAALAGRLAVLVGHSGVGKSSLLNALRPGLDLATKAVGSSHRGKHTTSASTLYDLGDGTRIIDTPGIREFGLWELSVADVAAGFIELAPYAGRCRFADCTHVGEPGCAVRRAVAAGHITRERYASYVRLATGDDAAPDVGEEGGELCAHCGHPIPPAADGGRQRNHCPACLHSVHLDNRPGDRAARCGGLMDPIAVWVRRSGEWALVHRCRDCGRLSSTRVAADDNDVLLMSLAVKPLSMPPFPLDRLRRDERHSG